VKTNQKRKHPKHDANLTTTSWERKR